MVLTKALAAGEKMIAKLIGEKVPTATRSFRPGSSGNCG